MLFGRFRGGVAAAPDQSLDDPGRHLVLHSENIFKIAVKAVRPKMISADGIDQLNIDAHTTGGTTALPSSK